MAKAEGYIYKAEVLTGEYRPNWLPAATLTIAEAEAPKTDNPAEVLEALAADLAWLKAHRPDWYARASATLKAEPTLEGARIVRIPFITNRYNNSRIYGKAKVIGEPATAEEAS